MSVELSDHRLAPKVGCCRAALLRQLVTIGPQAGRARFVSSLKASGSRWLLFLWFYPAQNGATGGLAGETISTVQYRNMFAHWP